MNLLARVQRIEALLKKIVARITSSESVKGVTQGVLRNVPNDNVRRDIASVPVTSPHPIFVEVFFMIKDTTLNVCMWSRLRAEISGDPAGAAVLIGPQNEFQVIQVGFANPPTVLVVLSGDGLRVIAQIQNPVAGNATVDVEATITQQISAAG